ncbi:1-acyl-sn-glycerol-3-phosphate acyltransferase [Oligoflexaceae bacterium]|nr:1-acyl-sn-glycerol-3-phosphate acyltransferase [Oligoflexaceae bacterium]
MKYVKGLWFWTTAVFLTTVTHSIISVARFLNMIGFPVDYSEFAHTASGVWGRSMFFLTPGWNMEVYGKENLPPKGKAVVYVSNHQSNADIWAVYFLRRRFSWLSKAEVFKIPMIGRTMGWAGYIGIKRGIKTSHVEAMEQSKQRLKDNISMFFFPEGTRSKDKRLQSFKSGAFRLAEECKVDIVPLILKGTGDLLEKGSLIPASHAKVELHVMPTIAHVGKTPNQLCDETHKAMLEKYSQLSPEYSSNGE